MGYRKVVAVAVAGLAGTLSLLSAPERTKAQEQVVPWVTDTYYIDGDDTQKVYKQTHESEEAAELYARQAVRKGFSRPWRHPDGAEGEGRLHHPAHKVIVVVTASTVGGGE